MEGLYNASLETLQAQLVRQVEQALLCLDPLERQEYTIAIKIVPDLVSKETRIIDFLRTENYVPVNAAKRLALYWKFRYELFGGERWLLPLNLTGTGALSPTDVALLETGCQLVFQRDPQDGLLFLMDEARVGPTMRFDERASARIAFYYGTIFTDEVTQLRGATLIHLVKANPPPAERRSAFPDGRRMIRTGLPLRFQQILVTRAHQPGDDTETVLKLMEQTAMDVQVNFLQFPRIIMADSPQATLPLLESAGCRKALLPPCIGGDFSYTQLTEWIATRFAMECAQAESNNNNFSASFLASAMSPKMPAVAAVAAPAVTLLQSPTSQTQMQPQIHSKEQSQQEKQKYFPATSTFPAPLPASITRERQSSSSSSLPTAPGGTVPSVASSNKSGKPKIDETAAAAPKTGETLSAEEIRKRNALYSRRTYHKRKMELSSLEEQVKLLEPRNKALREENLRLEALIHDAQRLLGAFGAQVWT